MNHNAAVSELEAMRNYPSDRRGHYFTRPVVAAAMGCAVIALMLIGPGFAVPARAQTMGEYGGVTAQSAHMAATMPRVGAPDIAGHANSAPASAAASSGSQQVQTYDTPSNDRSDDDKDADKADNSHTDWDQVK
jgi:hypothetical protein